MRNIIVAATAALTLTSTATFATEPVIIFDAPTFYTEFVEKPDKNQAPVAKTNTKATNIIAIKANTEQDTDN